MRMLEPDVRRPWQNSQRRAKSCGNDLTVRCCAMLVSLPTLIGRTDRQSPQRRRALPAQRLTTQLDSPAQLVTAPIAALFWPWATPTRRRACCRRASSTLLPRNRLAAPSPPSRPEPSTACLRGPAGEHDQQAHGRAQKERQWQRRLALPPPGRPGEHPDVVVQHRDPPPAALAHPSAHRLLCRLPPPPVQSQRRVCPFARRERRPGRPQEPEPLGLEHSPHAGVV